MLKILLFFYSDGSNVMTVFRVIKQKGKLMEKSLNLFNGKLVYRRGIK